MNVENIKKVRDVIATLRPERFDMSTEGAFREAEIDMRFDVSNGTLVHNCETAACVAGWTCAVLGNPADDPNMPDAREHLGIDEAAGNALFTPFGWEYIDFTPAQAVAVLDHLIATGEVDWSVAEQVTA